ncbi:expressed unknown protein [Seminavis robusta]|uniref:Uncharacterized protein n=1 Tax=Seminavis robusta TaxID=568900 RepID=A0A9N8H4A2_9STRA|nr:expressed unknown protein [Seminavis robusta]|eukprot:Sro80_g043050.1 n/a (255) ;mRNA; r:51383-52147
MQHPQMELFVIQRCWYSGPHVEPSVDCRRLFTSRREAEEVAYHSAHEFANQNIFATAAANNAKPATVKTLLLPPYANCGESSYAFQTCGKLFWVRSLQATIVPFVFGATSFDKAEVVFTEGIIGGTGNRNSRRGSEAKSGHVFCGADAKRCAIDALTQKLTLDDRRMDIKVTVDQIPIGKAAHTTAVDWPPSQRLLQQQQQHQMQFGHTMEEEEEGDQKREWNVENPNLPSKRQCKLNRQEPQDQQAVSCSMMF